MEAKETITEEDKAKTLAKFTAWDLLKDNPEGLRLLADPTIFAYAFFKDKQKGRLRLRAFQDIFINDKSPLVVCASSNQVGKSLAAEIKILHHALFVPNATVLVTSRNYDLSKKILVDIREMCIRSNFDISDIIYNADNVCTLTIKNWDSEGVSKIVCVAPTESALSYDATLIVVDEGAFITNGVNFFLQCLFPRTYATRNWKHPEYTMGQILVISNPNRQQGLLWYLWNLEESSRYRFNFLVNPDNTVEEYLKLKHRLPIDIFDSTVDARFTSATGSYITEYEYNDAVKDVETIPIPMSYTLGIGGDLAGEDVTSRSTDNNVIYVGYSEKEGRSLPLLKVCYRKSYPAGTPRKVIIEEIKRLWLTYQVIRIAYDKVGVGDSFKNQLIEHEIPEYAIESLTYSLPNKSEVYHNLKTLYEQRRIKHQDYPELREQLLSLDFEATASGHLKIHHDKETTHDDDCDALANCAWAVMRGDSVPASAHWV